MRRGESLTDIFTIEEVIENPRAVQVTYRQGNIIVVQKQLKDLAYEIVYDEDETPSGVQIMCYLSQEETLRFCANDDTLVQVRIIDSDGEALVSTIEKIKVQECLDCNILPLEE